MLFTNPIPHISARGALVARLRGRKEPLFGVSVEPIAGNLEEISEIAHLADQHELGLLAVPDRKEGDGYPFTIGPVADRESLLNNKAPLAGRGLCTNSCRSFMGYTKIPQSRC